MLTMSRVKVTSEVTRSVRDDLIIEATPLVTNDADLDRAWTIEQALSSYKRLRIRLLSYVEERKKEKS